MSEMHREQPDEIISNGGRNADGSARMLSRWTFEYEPARSIVEEHMHGRVLNACAGKTKLQHDDEIVRNDLNPDRDADVHLDVAEIAGTLCGHCSDAGCNHFDDHCKAAEREVTWTDV